MNAEPPDTSHGLVPLAARLARVGGWSIDTATDRVDWSDAINQILEFPPGVVPALDEALAVYPEPDRSVVIDALEACRSSGR
ncbi:MAG: hypothetical protein ACLGHQ_08415, partial [Acidimicrobiia bacterium]